MKLKLLVFFLFVLIYQTKVYAQEIEEVICWGVTEYNTESFNHNSADAITIFYHGATLKLLVMNSECEKLIYDMDIQKLYLDQTIAQDSSYLGVRGPITLIEKKNQKHEEGHLYLSCSNNAENPDILKLKFTSYEKIYLCKAITNEMKNDLLALAVIGTSTKFSKEEYERRLKEAINLSE